SFRIMWEKMLSVERGLARADVQLLFHRVVIQVLSQPPFDFLHGHSFALAVVGNLITFDLAEAEIARFRMGKVKAVYARSRPHDKKLCQLNSRIPLNIEQTPKCALL